MKVGVPGGALSDPAQPVGMGRTEGTCMPERLKGENVAFAWPCDRCERFVVGICKWAGLSEENSWGRGGCGSLNGAASERDDQRDSGAWLQPPFA